MNINFYFQRLYVENIEEFQKHDEILEKNRILVVKVGSNKWKIVVGDGMTVLGKLSLQDTFAYDPNEVYTSGNGKIFSHHED